MKLARREAVLLWNGLNGVAEVKAGVKFAYAVAKNLRLLKGMIDTLQAESRPSPEVQKFEQARLRLCMEHCEKTADNKPVIEEGKFKLADEPAFQEGLVKLKEEYAPALEAAAQKAAAIEQQLDEIIELPIHQIAIEEMPDFSATQVDLLLPMVIDTDAPTREMSKMLSVSPAEESKE